MENRAKILPVPETTDRPLWSVMIPTYNCAQYLEETLLSVLQQDPGPQLMQIEVVDDCSKDNPEELVRRVGKGRISFYRQAQNVGHIRNFEVCLQRARGILVHQLHGDDKIRMGFYKKMQGLFDQYSQIGAAFCRNITINEDSQCLAFSAMESSKPGVLEGWLYKIAEKQRLQTPAMVVKREVYEKLGGFDTRLSWTEDWEMWVRIAANYPVAYEPEPLAEYRIHTNSNTSKYILTGENMRDYRRAIHIISLYIPNEQRLNIEKKSRKQIAYRGLRMAKNLLIQFNNKKGAKAQLKEAFAFYQSPGFFISLAKVYLKTL